jgi:uncharacterized membrane protein
MDNSSLLNIQRKSLINTKSSCIISASSFYSIQSNKKNNAIDSCSVFLNLDGWGEFDVYNSTFLNCSLPSAIGTYKGAFAIHLYSTVWTVGFDLCVFQDCISNGSGSSLSIFSEQTVIKNVEEEKYIDPFINFHSTIFNNSFSKEEKQGSIIDLFQSSVTFENCSFVKNSNK